LLGVVAISRNRLKRKIACRALVFRAPLLEKTSIAQRDVGRPFDAHLSRAPVNPLRLAFKFSEYTDRRFIDNAMAFAIGPLAAPFLVPERLCQPDGFEDLS